MYEQSRTLAKSLRCCDQRFVVLPCCAVMLVSPSVGAIDYGRHYEHVRPASRLIPAVGYGRWAVEPHSLRVATQAQPQLVRVIATTRTSTARLFALHSSPSPPRSLSVSPHRAVHGYGEHTSTRPGPGWHSQQSPPSALYRYLCPPHCDLRRRSTVLVRHTHAAPLSLLLVIFHRHCTNAVAAAPRLCSLPPFPRP